MAEPRHDAAADLAERVLAEVGGWHPEPDEVDRRPRIGMVLGAGGVLGNAYLSGAVAALYDATGFEPRTASVLVGTSAGAVHAALYGAGMPALFGLWRARGGVLPADLLAAADATTDLGESQTLKDIFTPARALPRLGPAALGLAVRATLQPWAYRPEVMLSAWLPEGVFTNAAIGIALRRIVPSGWAPHRRTWLTAVSLRTGRRAVFGQPGSATADLGQAVQASCAIPGLHRPVRIGRDRYIDGGMHSPSNADLVADLDLDLVVIVNPMSTLEGRAAAGIVDRYLYPPRRFAERRLATERRLLEERGVPTLILAPSTADLEVFSRNLMDSRPRREVAETAVETTREQLAAPATAAAVRLLRRAARTAAR